LRNENRDLHWVGIGIGVGVGLGFGLGECLSSYGVCLLRNWSWCTSSETYRHAYSQILIVYVHEGGVSDTHTLTHTDTHAHTLTDSFETR